MENIDWERLSASVLAPEALEQLARELGLPKIEPGQDVHRLVAAKMFSVAYDDVTPEQRRAAKIANFRSLYP
jgi:DNA polymerase I-like protein with 3'-5' exonuclease and polymerase domains